MLKAQSVATLALLPLLLLCGQPAWSFIAAPSYGGPVSGVWAGVGDVVAQSGTQCVVSTEDRPRDDPGDGKRVDYLVTVDVVGGTAFTVTSVSSGLSVPFSLSYFNGGGQASPIPQAGTPNGPFKGGRNRNCNRASRFEVLFLEADLRGMPADTYLATLSITHINTVTGETASGSLQVSLRIDAASIEITAVANIELGTWDIVSPSLAANESFCVSGTALLYQITATGDTGQFSITNGIDTIVYEVLFAPTTDASGGTPLIHGVPEGSYALPDLCAGDNAAIYIQTITPLGSVGEGAYVGQLTLTVEPA